MINANNLKKGSIIKLNNELYYCLEYQHIKPGKGGAFVKLKLKMMKKSKIIDKTFRSEEKIENVYVERRKVQYLYQDNNILIIMDLENYEQFEIDKNLINDNFKFLLEGMEIEADFYESKIINIILPIFVQMKVTYTEPGIKGDSVSGATKEAIVESGYKLQVPLFINNDDILKIDTRTGEYITRIS